MAQAHKLMIVIRKAPHGTIYVQEAIEVMFIMASFDMDLSIVFLDDGVNALKTGQDTKQLGIKGFSASLGALMDWDVNQVFADQQSLADRNILKGQLLSIGQHEDTEEIMYPKIIDTQMLNTMMKNQDSILSF